MRLRLTVPAAVLAVTAVVGGVLLSEGGAPAPQAEPVAEAAPVTQTVLPQQASRSRVAQPVAPLRKVVTPDLMITTAKPLTQKQISAVAKARGVTHATVISTGVSRVGTRAVPAMGIDPSTFRPFTPKPTAASEALWASIARGDLAVSYASKLPLGGVEHVYFRKAVDARIGAVAAFDLPRSALVMNRVRAREIGLVTDTIVLAAPERKLSRLERELRAILGQATDFTELRPAKVVNRRPKTYTELYKLSASYCPGLSWTVLAAIGQVESGHGRNLGPSSAGALGPMQFMPATWAAYAVDGDGDGKADIMSAYDAVPAAALYLCRNGAGRGGQSLYDAIFNYNHADWYVKKVLALAKQYEGR